MNGSAFAVGSSRSGCAAGALFGGITRSRPEAINRRRGNVTGDPPLTRLADLPPSPRRGEGEEGYSWTSMISALRVSRSRVATVQRSVSQPQHSPGLRKSLPLFTSLTIEWVWPVMTTSAVA